MYIFLLSSCRLDGSICHASLPYLDERYEIRAELLCSGEVVLSLPSYATTDSSATLLSVGPLRRATIGLTAAPCCFRQGRGGFPQLIRAPFYPCRRWLPRHRSSYFVEPGSDKRILPSPRIVEARPVELVSYEATSTFTLVTTRIVAHPALQDFVDGLQKKAFPIPPAIQATWLWLLP